MSTLELVLLMLLVVDAVALAALVLLQQGRGAEVGAAFGSGASNTMFGSGGSASFLTKLTVWLAIGFFLISGGLAWTAKERAAQAGSLGVPQIESPLVDAGATESIEGLSSEVPADVGQGAGDTVETMEDESLDAIEQLTDESESVDSDIPDV